MIPVAFAAAGEGTVVCIIVFSIEGAGLTERTTTLREQKCG
jgi:hypothetical protein